MLNDATNDDWLPGLVTQLRKRVNLDIEKMLPCKVVKAGRKKVTVKPLIAMIDADGNRVSRQQLVDIPVMTHGAGNFLISFNISEDDLGWIDASDRDISLFIQSHTENIPATDRMHSFSDARFIPDIMFNFSIAGEDSSAMVIQNRDGTVKIALDSEIRATVGATKATLTDGAIDVIAPGGATVNGAQITSGGDVITASGISLDNHTHSGVTSGSSNTGGPN